MKKTNKILYISLAIVVLLLLGIFSQGFTLIGEEIYTPKYFTGECVPRADNMAEITISSHTDEGSFYHCTAQDTGKYIPLVNGVQCEYQIFDFSSASVYVCDGVTTNKADLDTAKCEKVFGILSSVSDWIPFRINAGDTIYINTNKIIGDAQLKAKYPSFGLRTRTADGFVSPTTLTCEINSLSTSYHTLDVGSRTEILPDFPFNAVQQLQKAYSTQAVRLDDVEGGKEIYISRPQYYYMIKTAEDGFKFLDTAGGEKFSANIECFPRTTGCSDDAKIIPLAEQSCDEFGGAITNYAPVEGDSTKLCKYECVEATGTLKLTSDCIQVQSSCPAEKPLWDTTTGECVAVVTKPEQPQDLSIILIVGLSVIAIILLMLIIKQKQLGKKR